MAYMTVINCIKKISLIDKLACNSIFVTKRRNSEILKKANEKIKEFNSKISKMDQDLKLSFQRNLTQHLEDEFASFYNIAAWESAPLLECAYNLIDYDIKKNTIAFENEVNQWKKETSAKKLETKIKAWQNDQFLDKALQMNKISKNPELKTNWENLRREVNAKIEEKYKVAIEYLKNLTTELKKLETSYSGTTTKSYAKEAQNTYLVTIEILKGLQEILKKHQGVLHDSEIPIIQNFFQNKLVIPKWWIKTAVTTSSLIKGINIETLYLIMGIIGITEDSRLSPKKFVELYKKDLEEKTKQAYFEKERKNHLQSLWFDTFMWSRKIQKEKEYNNFKDVADPFLKVLKKLQENLSLEKSENLESSQWDLIEKYFKEGFKSTVLDEEEHKFYLPPQLKNLNTQNKELITKLIKSINPLKPSTARYLSCINKLKKEAQNNK